jgi:DNA repair exonuclease SbcCD nuclease subunit
MVRIMLATDNHIGYLERDPIRGQDSINTFREILQLAVKHDVSSCGFCELIAKNRTVAELSKALF